MTMFDNLLGYLGIRNPKANNPNLDAFDFPNEDKPEQGSSIESVVQKFYDEANKVSTSLNFSSTSSYNDIVYGSIPTNKPNRLSSYRNMASFPEVADCIDEICDSALVKNENNETIFLNIKNSDIDETMEEELQRAFNEYIELFDLDSNLFEFLRRFIIEGELAWENIIDRENPEYGIVNIEYIEPECYEYAFETTRNKRVGLSLFTSPIGGNESRGSWWNPVPGTPIQSNSSLVFPSMGIPLSQLSNKGDVEKEKALFLPFEQVTYISTAIYNDAGTFVYPLLERARKAYNQLTLIEDAIIIYRLVRAPERLVFNVDVGDLSRAKAEYEVKKMMQRYQTKRVYNPSSQSVTNDYDPHTMMETFWFMKPNGGTGTTVEKLTLGGGNLGELTDLDYFLRKLYTSMKVPMTRFGKDPKQKLANAADNISDEEFRFSKFIIRILQNFASGFKNGFITHIKLKGLWNAFNLNSRDFSVDFVPPISYELYAQQKLLEMKVKNYETATSNKNEFSKSLAMKKFLLMSDKDIEENDQYILNDRIRNARMEWIENFVKKEGITPEEKAEQDEAKKKGKKTEPMFPFTDIGGGPAPTPGLSEFGAGSGGGMTLPPPPPLEENPPGGTPPGLPPTPIEAPRPTTPPPIETPTPAPGAPPMLGTPPGGI